MPRPLIVAVITFDRFSPFHCSVPCLIFGDKMMPGQSLFELRLCAGDDTRQPASSQGFRMEADYGLEGLLEADIIIIPFWRDPAERPAQPLLDALVAARIRGAQIVGLCLGTYVLAYAGLLDGRGAATHWEFEQEFVQRFPRVRLDTNALYVDDDGLITSAGTAASLDCCLYLVRQHHGSQIANKLARRLVVCLPTGRVARPSSSSSRCPPPPGMPGSTSCSITCACTWPRPTPWIAWRNIA